MENVPLLLQDCITELATKKNKMQSEDIHIPGQACENNQMHGLF
jgi:hypothetical protein